MAPRWLRSIRPAALARWSVWMSTAAGVIAALWEPGRLAVAILLVDFLCVVYVERLAAAARIEEAHYARLRGLLEALTHG